MYPIPPPMESEQPKTAREVQPKVAEEATRDRHHITEPTNIFEEVGKQANPNLENLAKLENMAFMTPSSKNETIKEENNHPTNYKDTEEEKLTQIYQHLQHLQNCIRRERMAVTLTPGYKMKKA